MGSGTVTEGQQDYWEAFYLRRIDDVPKTPSSFARWVDARLTPTTDVVDVGCGTARDAIWLARSGRRVVGLDYSSTAIARARGRAVRTRWPVDFVELNLYDSDAVAGVAATLGAGRKPVAVYARFLVHAIRETGRHNLWTLARTVVTARGQGSLFLEFRTGKDAASAHLFGDHYRNYLDPELVVAELESRGGVVQYLHEGQGLAVYREEDPYLCRMVVTW